MIKKKQTGLREKRFLSFKCFVITFTVASLTWLLLAVKTIFDSQKSRALVDGTSRTEPKTVNVKSNYNNISLRANISSPLDQSSATRASVLVTKLEAPDLGLHPLPILITNSNKIVLHSNQVQRVDSESVLIVGGTDGSGTRRVVQILAQLGVNMVSEDPETYDIHADLVGGWPTVAHPLLQYTRGLMYDPSTFPPQLHQKLSSSLKALLSRAELDSHLPESQILAVGGVLNKPAHIDAAAIKFGFKAPISMVFVPFWKHLLPRFKFLHVVRDGRDIAFSANQGPVEKFYNDVHPHSEAQNNVIQREIQAAQLWSEWNSQIYTWSKQHISGSEIKSNNNYTYDYFVLHSEDLVSTNMNVKYDVVMNLAIWLSSNISASDLCCVACSGSEFMGSHDRTERKDVDINALNSRYGKWRRNPNKQLINQLHSYGQEGLELFGYQPENRRYTDSINQIALQRSNNVNSETQRFKSYSQTCQSKLPSKQDCQFLAQQSKSLLLPISSYTSRGICKIELGVDYRSMQDLFVTPFDPTKPHQCCDTCKQSTSCKYFTIDMRNSLCYLKSVQGTSVENDRTTHLVSGSLL